MAELYSPSLEAILMAESESDGVIIRTDDDVYISLTSLAALIDAGTTLNIEKLGIEAATEPMGAVTTFMSWVPQVLEHHQLLRSLDDGTEAFD